MLRVLIVLFVAVVMMAIENIVLATAFFKTNESILHLISSVEELRKDVWKEKYTNRS